MTPITETPPFEEHYRSAFQVLRNALTELLLAADADPGVPQDVARRFGLNRGLTWKIARITSATDPFEVFAQLPGASAIDILIKAFRKAGVAEERLAAVRDAVDEFDRMTLIHAGDRATLELMLDSISAGNGRSEPLEMSRKLAYRGNSGIRGIQARAKLRTTFLAPNSEDGSLLDIAQVSGLIHLRRLRPHAAWPLFVKAEFNDDGSPLERPEQPIEKGESDSMLMTEYCSTPLPSIRVVPFDRGTISELGDGPVGNRGAGTIVYGSFTRAFAPRYRDDANEYGECFADINAPVESLLFDLIVHEELAARMKLEARLYQGDQPSPYFGRRAVELPCPETIQDIGTAPPRVATALMPRYTQLVQSVFDRLGWNANEFRGLRFEMKYPPVPSKIVLRFPLEERG